MRVRFLVGRLIALPVRHKLIAGGIAMAFLAGCLVWTRHLPPQEYIGSALLFFDRTAVPTPDPGKVHTDQIEAIELAKAVLSDDLVNALCKHFALYPDSRGGEAARFRSNLMLSRESTSSLRVTWRGTDRSQTVTVTNTVSMLLTSWVPDAGHRRPDPGPPVPVPLAAPIEAFAPIEQNPRIGQAQANLSPMKARLQTVLNDEKELRFELTTADQRLTALGDEARKLQASIGQASAEREANLTARQPLTEQLATDKKRLDLLRVRYTDAYPDVEAAQERIAETEKKLAAMPVMRPAPSAEQSRLNALTKEMNNLGAERLRLSGELSKKARLKTYLRNQRVEGSKQGESPEQASTDPQPGQSKPTLTDPTPSLSSTTAGSQILVSTDGDQVRPFRILERAADAQPTSNSRRLLIWLVAAAGPLFGVLYLLLAIWWFRAVRDAETLETIVPENIAYLGAIPGINTWRHSL
jgi:hypothetical protein